jgi:hypothetical protein
VHVLDDVINLRWRRSSFWKYPKRVEHRNLHGPTPLLNFKQGLYFIFKCIDRHISEVLRYFLDHHTEVLFSILFLFCSTSHSLLFIPLTQLFKTMKSFLALVSLLAATSYAFPGQLLQPGTILPRQNGLIRCSGSTAFITQGPNGPVKRNCPSGTHCEVRT